MARYRIFAAFGLVALLANMSAWVQPQNNNANALLPPESDVGQKAPVDYGLGPGVVPARTVTAASSLVAPSGSSTAGTMGMFGAPVQWPIVAIHMVLLPDGRVMNYGTNQYGQQGAQFVYDVWDPTLGTGSNAHLVLSNTTATDIFCSGQLVLPSSGKVLVTGGDLTISGKRNYSQNDIELFDPTSNNLAAITQMQYPRWYPSLVTMPNGEILVMGGRTSPTTAATVPEVYNPVTGWRTLTGAANLAAFGTQGLHWYYPRGFVNSAGNVILVNPDGRLFRITTASTGKIGAYTATTTQGSRMLPTVSYAPNKLLSVRSNASPEMIDITGNPALFTPAPGISQDRFWSSATVMANGQILITGGSLVANQLQGVAYEAEIWDPATNTWSIGASASKPRLYHSNALLLPDGAVISAGGGAPGPVINLNAEIYYPAYLYKNDGTGQLADRPTFAVSNAVVHIGGTLLGNAGAGQQISRLTLIRTGSATHSTNLDQRLFQLPFTQTGQTITATLPKGVNVLVPGYYMVFAFDTSNVPAIANIVLVQP